MHTGISGVVVDARDFKVWETYVRGELFPKHGPKEIKLHGLALRLAIAMIWPDQSYTSLRVFRGPSKKKLCEFHTTRIQALCGEYICLGQHSYVCDLFAILGGTFLHTTAVRNSHHR